MILKEPDDKNAQVKTLESLLNHPRLPVEKKPAIERELSILRAGMKGEREAAYDINFYSGAHNNRVVIHDLRVEFNGQVAEIDHLIINRLLEVFVIETKHFSEGISISETGEFTAWYGGKGRGIPSPLEQNKRHIQVLRGLFKEIDMPKRAGLFTLQPDFVSIVLVSKNARIARPKTFDTHNVVKSDLVESWIRKHLDGGSPLQLAKLVGEETLLDIGRQLVLRHRPLKPDFLGKFGIETRTLAEPKPGPIPAAPIPAENETVSDTDGIAQGKKRRLQCSSCGSPVTYSVAKFCWSNKKKFGGNVYCMNCQRDVRDPAY